MDRVRHWYRTQAPKDWVTTVNLKEHFTNQLPAVPTDVQPPRYVPSAPGEESILHEVIHPAMETEEGAALREEFATLAGMGEEEQLNTLAEMMTLEFLAGNKTSEADLQALRGQFKEAVRQTMHKFKDGKSLLPAEKAFLADCQARIDHIKVLVATATGAQVKNTSTAAWIPASMGFGFIALFMKLLINFSPLGVGASYFVNFAGPLILLFAELAAGKYRAQGPGFGAVDSDAYQKWDDLNAQMYRLNAEVAGMAANPGTPPEMIDEAKRRFTEMRIGQQKAVFDCLTRELGHDTGLKPDDHLPDVPKDTLLACLHSKLTGDKATGEVRLPDGTLFLTVLDDKGDVMWPSLACTNLLTEPVPGIDVPTFEKGAKLLIEAARCRSMLCDDLTFHLFSLPFLWNMAGPFVLTTMHASLLAQLIDTFAMVGSSFGGTFLVMNVQNYLRGRYTGAGTSAGLHNAASQVSHEKAKFEEQAFKARVEQGLNIVNELKADVTEAEAKVKKATALIEALTTELQDLANETTKKTESLRTEIDKKTEQLYYAEFAFANAQKQLAAKTIDITAWDRAQGSRDKVNSQLFVLKNGLDAFKDSTSEKIVPINEKLIAARENLDDLEVELHGLNISKAKADVLYGNIVKSLAAAQRRVTLTGRKAGATWILMKDVYEDLFKKNPVRAFVKLLAYDLCYMAYGGPYTYVASKVVTSLSGKMAMAALGGTFMSSIFMWRNSVFTNGLQLILHGLIGEVGKVYYENKSYPSTSVSEMPQFLEESPIGDDTLAEGGLHLSDAWDAWANVYEDQLKSHEVKPLGQILSNLARLEDVGDAMDRLDHDEISSMAVATAVMLERWGDWGGVFGREQSAMRDALGAIQEWTTRYRRLRSAED